MHFDAKLEEAMRRVDGQFADFSTILTEHRQTGALTNSGEAPLAVTVLQSEVAKLRREFRHVQEAVDGDVLDAFQKLRAQTGDIDRKVERVVDLMSRASHESQSAWYSDEMHMGHAVTLSDADRKRLDAIEVRLRSLDVPLDPERFTQPFLARLQVLQTEVAQIKCEQTEGKTRASEISENIEKVKEHVSELVADPLMTLRMEVDRLHRSVGQLTHTLEETICSIQEQSMETASGIEESGTGRNRLRKFGTNISLRSGGMVDGRTDIAPRIAENAGPPFLLRPLLSRGGSTLPVPLSTPFVVNSVDTPPFLPQGGHVVGVRQAASAPGSVVTMPSVSIPTCTTIRPSSPVVVGASGPSNLPWRSSLGPVRTSSQRQTTPRPRPNECRGLGASNSQPNFGTMDYVVSNNERSCPLSQHEEPPPLAMERCVAVKRAPRSLTPCDTSASHEVQTDELERGRPLHRGSPVDIQADAQIQSPASQHRPASRSFGESDGVFFGRRLDWASQGPLKGLILNRENT